MKNPGKSISEVDDSTFETGTGICDGIVLFFINISGLSSQLFYEDIFVCDNNVDVHNYSTN